MSKLVTDAGITIEAKGNTLYISDIPNTEDYKYGVFSLKRDWEKLENQTFPAGVWKDVKDGKATYTLVDRGEGEHKVFISFTKEKEAYPNYTMTHVFSINIDSDGNVEII